jgi:hypothetical protein
MKVVRYGRRMMGATSEAYWAATLWNAPHGMPRNVSTYRLQHAVKDSYRTVSRQQQALGC